MLHKSVILSFRGMSLRSQFQTLDKKPANWNECFAKLHHEANLALRERKFTFKDAIALDNGDKNRYSNVLPFDQNRVHLNESNDVGTDYINASPVVIPVSKRKYILAQGPVEDSVDDFWQMVFENDVKCIVMLNKLFEGDALKCEEYFPSRGNNLIKFDVHTVELEEETDRSNFIVRKIKTTNSAGESRVVTHVQYTEWPDFGVPESSNTFLAFLSFVKSLNVLTVSDDDPPVIVHCSAGIGRSGTFVLVDVVLRMIELGVPEEEISVEKLLISMRCQRNGLIQTATQLRFCWQSIVDGITDIQQTKSPQPDEAIPIVNEEPVAAKKRHSESQDEIDDRLSKRREMIAQMVAKSRAHEASRHSSDYFKRTILSSGAAVAVALAATIIYYIYRK